ncbi:hypothetical protein C3L33_03383, partial [Rhododendron williamsianum]
MLPPNPILLLAAITASCLLFRFLYKTSVLQIVRSWGRLIADKCHVHQTYRIPQFNEHMQENHLYRKVSTYLNSLPAVEDSDGANLFAGQKPNDIVPVLDDNQTLIDAFLGARVHWANERSDRDGSRALVLRIRRKDKRRILRPYLQHIHATFEDIDQRKKEVKLYLNAEERPDRNGRWRSMLLLHTTNKSLIVIEDLDRYLAAKPTAVSLSGILNFMDGIFSCCGEERVMVFTMNGKDQIDPAVLRPGRIDVHVYFPLCDFSAFKTLASSYLGLKEHKLFPQVEEVFQTGASLSPAEIGEIMISNRTSPSRAIKTVITALQSNSVDRRGPGNLGQRLTESSSGRSYGEPGECGSSLPGKGPIR